MMVTVDGVKSRFRIHPGSALPLSGGSVLWLDSARRIKMNRHEWGPIQTFDSEDYASYQEEVQNGSKVADHLGGFAGRNQRGGPVPVDTPRVQKVHDWRERCWRAFPP